MFRVANPSLPVIKCLPKPKPDLYMFIQKGFNLQRFNTFGIEATAAEFITAEDESQVAEALTYARSQPLYILGGGSNVLLTGDLPGVTILVRLHGISLIYEDDAYYYVRAAAGEIWHDFVRFCISRGYAGVENLSLIPGSVGAGPMQNIGAYGVELEQVFVSLDAIHVHTLEKRIFEASECKFGYRSSIFKTYEKGNWLITSVLFRLRKNPEFNISYGAIQEELEKAHITDLTIKAVSDAVIRIRRSKLPDPDMIGNAGSFFKNPVIPIAHFEQIKKKYPSIPSYAADGGIKLAAGWLIEQAGWKGKTSGKYGVHTHQALVLVNYGGASGADIWQLSEDIRTDILNKFGIELEREVNILP